MMFDLLQKLVSDSEMQQRLSLAGCVADPGGALVKGILEPLDSLKMSGKIPSNMQCVIVVDGLCEVNTYINEWKSTD